MSRHRMRCLLLLLSIVAPLAGSATGSVAAVARPRLARRLHQRLGGYDTIARTVVAFWPISARIPRSTAMVTGLSDASRLRNRQMITDQICMLTAGRYVFVGRPNAVSHQGLQIDRGMWDKSQKALADAPRRARREGSREGAI